MSLLCGLVVLVLALGSTVVFASEKEKPTRETYTARTGLSPVHQLDNAVSLTIVVDRYTSEEELKEFAAMLKSKGIDPLKRSPCLLQGAVCIADFLHRRKDHIDCNEY